MRNAHPTFGIVDDHPMLYFFCGHLGSHTKTIVWSQLSACGRVTQYSKKNYALKTSVTIIEQHICAGSCFGISSTLEFLTV